MLKLSYLGLPYGRFIFTEDSLPAPAELKRLYSYVFILSFKKLDLPGFSVVEKKTPLIDLTLSEQEIFQTFNKTTRNEIRKTEHLPALIFCAPDENFTASYAIYKKVKKADGVPVELKREFRSCLFFNAYDKKQLVVSVSCWQTETLLRLKSIVSYRKSAGYEPRIMAYATRRLIWEICRYGKAHNYQTLDLGGINFNEKEKSGITQFKQSFNGRIVDVYIYRYESPFFHFLRKFLLKTGFNIN